MSLADLPPGTDLCQIPVVKPPPGVIPNLVNPESTAGPAIGVTVLFTVLMLFFVCVRLYTKFVVSRSKGWDDYICILACCCSLAYMAVVIDVVARGYSVHTWNFPVCKMTRTLLEALNAVTAFYGPTMFFTKLTLFILYYRLFSPSKTMRYLIFFGIGFNFLFYTIYTFLYSLMCPNVSKRAQTCGPRLKAMGVATSAINVVSDFYILLIPLAAISNLQLPPKKKWGLMGIFFTGFLACLCSIISLHYRVVLDKSTDDIWNVAPVMVIGTVEFNIGIICSCLPTLPALFRRSGFSRKSKPSYMPDSGNGQFENAAHPNGGRGGGAAVGRIGPSGGKRKEMGRADVDESKDSVATLEEGRKNATAVDGGAFEMNGLDAEEERKREWLRQARM